MTSMASTSLANLSTPSKALSTCRCNSKRNGIVTMATVSSPRDFASRAMIGEAPVPVPPPIPAVIKTIFVSSSKMSSIASKSPSASARPVSGSPPAPSPGPSCRRSGTALLSSAFRSVLQTRKRTSWRPSQYMLATAFPPPPPTPITLMIEERVQSTGSIRSSSFIVGVQRRSANVMVGLLTIFVVFD